MSGPNPQNFRDLSKDPNITAIKQKGGNIYDATRQWSKRPPDECFPDIKSMHEFCSGYRADSSEFAVPLSNSRIIDIEVEPSEQEIADSQDFSVVNPLTRTDIQLQLNSYKVGLHNKVEQDTPPVSFTNFSFRQFATRIHPSYGKGVDMLATLPAKTVAEVLNVGISTQLSPTDSHIVWTQTAGDQNRSPILRATNSEIYDRIWNADITQFLMGFDPRRWGPPHATRTETGTLISHTERGTGCYASDHDMFAFLVDTQSPLDVKGAELVRGFFISNNEVGRGSFEVCMFLCDYICGNHIIWDVKDSLRFKLRHVGIDADDIFKIILPMKLLEFAKRGGSLDEDIIQRAQNWSLGETEELVLNHIYEKRFASKKVAKQSYDYAVKRHDETGGCDPRSVWGMVCGMTAIARSIPFYDKRVILEENAARLIKVAT